MTPQNKNKIGYLVSNKWYLHKKFWFIEMGLILSMINLIHKNIYKY